MVSGGSFLFAVVYTTDSRQNAVPAMCPLGAHASLPSVRPSDPDETKNPARQKTKTGEMMRETDHIMPKLIDFCP
jgi:hypothetical protein